MRMRTVYDCEQKSYLKAVADRIRALRVQQGYSQESMALMVKMDRSYYGRVERGEKNLSLLKIKQIADVLGTSPANLLNFSEENS